MRWIRIASGCSFCLTAPKTGRHHDIDGSSAWHLPLSAVSTAVPWPATSHRKDQRLPASQPRLTRCELACWTCQNDLLILGHRASRLSTMSCRSSRLQIVMAYSRVPATIVLPVRSLFSSLCRRPMQVLALSCQPLFPVRPSPSFWLQTSPLQRCRVDHHC